MKKGEHWSAVPKGFSGSVQRERATEWCSLKVLQWLENLQRKR
jgi:hypothetical protein